MDKSVLTIPGSIIQLIVDNNVVHYIHINTITSDHKKGWWFVGFTPIYSHPVGVELPNLSLLVDDQQIRGEAFTVKGIAHQFCELPKFPEKFAEIKEEKKPVPKLVVKDNVVKIPFGK